MKQKSSFSLLTRLAWLTGIVVFISTVMTQSYFARHERTSLAMRLREKMTFITNFYAFGVADALEHNDDVTLQLVINRLEEDSEITSVIVVDDKGEIRYNADPDKVGTVLNDPLVKKALATNEGVANDFQNAGGKALVLVVPLKIRGQPTPIGALRIELTYHHIDDEVHTGQSSFHMVAMGSIIFSVGAILWGYRKWVLMPLNRLKNSVMAINPSLLESNLPESDDEFGQINASLNELLAKLKAEGASQRAALITQPSEERILVEGLLRRFMPDARLLLVNKENRVICDTADENPVALDQAPHLLDLVTDGGFVTLVGQAFKNEGDVASGPIVFQDQPYVATVVPLAEGMSKVIRTIIVLKTISELQTKKEAV